MALRTTCPSCQTAVNIPAEAMPRVIGLIVGALIALVAGIVMLFGAIAMMRRSSLNSARTAAICAAIPCFGGCVFPVGIWAAVLLFTGSFKRDFSG